MSKPNGSLIDQSDAQLELLPSTAIPHNVMAEEEAEGRYTGARLFAHDRETYLRVVSLLAEGLPIRSICRICGVGTHTVLAVREAEHKTVATVKERIGRKAEGLAGMCLDMIADGLDRVKVTEVKDLRDLGVLAGVLVDKSQLLQGQATSRVELTAGESLNDLASSLAKLPGGDKWVAPTIVDVDAELVCGEGEAGQKGVAEGAAVGPVVGGANG